MGPQGPKGDPGAAGGNPTLTTGALVGTWKIRHISTTTGQWEQVGEVTFSANGTYTATPGAYTLGGGLHLFNGTPVGNGTYQVIDGSVLVLMFQTNANPPPGFPPSPPQTVTNVALPVSVAAEKVIHELVNGASLTALEMLAK